MGAQALARFLVNLALNKNNEHDEFFGANRLAFLDSVGDLEQPDKDVLMTFDPKAIADHFAGTQHSNAKPPDVNVTINISTK